jgi:spermidine synthase
MHHRTVWSGSEVVLVGRDGEYQIRIDGRELMSSRHHETEEQLARLACGELRGVPEPRVLIGGLGMGFTLRAALDALAPFARVDVVEVMQPVIEWNLGPLAPLAGRPLDDGRVELRAEDVAAVIRDARRSYHAIVLDVDNGPGDLSLASNSWLYGVEGIEATASALVEEGVLAVWSASAAPVFEQRLRAAGFKVRAEAVAPSSGRGDVRHWIVVGHLYP